MLEVHSKVKKSRANYVGPELNVIEHSDFSNFLFTDFRAPLPPLFKIAWNSIALNTSSYDIARRRFIDWAIGLSVDFYL